MKKIKSIHLSQFKFFGESTPIAIDTKHLLLYGENGSGKSSIYWALYTLLECANKSNEEIKRYFKLVQEDEKSLINIFATDNTNSFVEIKLEDDTGYKISLNDTNINSLPRAKENTYASDFLNYKFLFNIHNFKHRDNINLFPLFEQEVFRYLQFPAIQLLPDGLTGITNMRPIRNAQEMYQHIKAQSAKPYTALVAHFIRELDSLLSEINRVGNTILQTKLGYPIKFRLKSNLTDAIYQRPTRSKFAKNPPIIYFEIAEYYGQSGEKIKKPHSFLNEAKLSAIGLAIRLAILEKRLQEADVKILVLDDLMISLDMSNRDKVLNLIFSEYLTRYQVFILTHDEAFYNIVKQKTLSRDWIYYKMYENKSSKSPEIKPDEDDFHKAKHFFEQNEYDACASYLRKETEKILKLFLDKDLKYIEKEFITLENLINNASNELNKDNLAEFNRKFKTQNGLNTIELNDFETLLGNVENNTAFTELQRGKIRGIIIDLMRYFVKIQKLTDNKIKILEELKEIKNRILNPRSHNQLGVVAPLYYEELENAIRLVAELRNWLISNV